MDALNLIDSRELRRRAGNLSDNELRYLRTKFPDLVQPACLAAGRWPMWQPEVVATVLQLRATLNLKSWKARRAKTATSAPDQSPAPKQA